MTTPAITLLTDFGTADGYVAELKGVLVSLSPSVPIVDLSHDIPPQDIAFGRLTVARYWRRFPAGTVHLVVVDPGVGTARAAIAIASEGRYLVGPDNGVLSPALFALDARVVQLPVDPAASATFHGRDVFAPVAARLALGASLEELGESYANPVRLRTPPPHRDAHGLLHGEVLTIDRFGNIITNLLTRDSSGMVKIGGRAARLVRTYGEASRGELVALIGSSGFVEVAVREGNAAATLGIERGASVVLG
ncbi:SAM-dependent chlorinase/fluorinase [Gemmatimonas sp.]|uniref:SAM hydrolase/SAM-dependent halogenase family protein n=1 Tax=Gemmatimonas sp. TaxID=1962908 RepID=UPI0025B9A787|nr:SAM-dependent chlorinase/fluorinase [Gemmatimonas sp.]MCA2990180.1 SAM-dependent chlorinase/fluorinase [Gemmatimonas sp.]